MSLTRYAAYLPSLGLIALGAVSLSGCDDPPTDAHLSSDVGVRDADTGDTGVLPPLPDTGFQCPFYREPNCEPNAVPPRVAYRPGTGCGDDDQCPEGYTCNRGEGKCRDDHNCLPAWECYECPRDPDIRCPFPLSPQPDRYGCISAESECGCSITEEPSCPPPSQPQKGVAQTLCAEDGRRCFTGACIEHQCDCTPEPDCPTGKVSRKDEFGCTTGGCVRPDCPPIEPEECVCGKRPAKSEFGCYLGPCELEPIGCPSVEVPVCSPQQIPELDAVTRCLTGLCIPGSVDLCRPACDVDRDCATSDRCRPYAGACKTCQPRSCAEDLDCPARTDCVAGRCRTREQHGCDACEDLGLVCDDPGCGKCAQACECREHDECPATTRCVDCACVPGCRDDAECADGLGCDPDSGQCRECTCDDHAGCDEGKYCDGCFCNVGCRDDNECPPWTACSLVAHECEPIIQCTPGRRCPDPELCVDSQCVRNPGRCDDGTGCRAAWRPRVGYVCIKTTDAIRGCEGNPPPEDCIPDEDTAPPACLCDIDECRAQLCDGPARERCPGGPYHCAKGLDDYANPALGGICREGRPEARRLCRNDGDCVPEGCDVATFCVHRDDASCQSRIPDDSREDRPTITGCSCVGDVCVTDYDFD